jgi:hypothetical protein
VGPIFDCLPEVQILELFLKSKLFAQIQYVVFMLSNKSKRRKMAKEVALVVGGTSGIGKAQVYRYLFVHEKITRLC